MLINLSMQNKVDTAERAPIEFLATSAEAIPLGDMAVDAVVTTWTLCTIPERRQGVTGNEASPQTEGVHARLNSL